MGDYARRETPAMSENARDVLTRIVSKWRAPSVPYPEFLQFLDSGQADEIIDAFTAAGFAVVPIEPTERMKDIGLVTADLDPVKTLSGRRLAVIWKAMLSAAPKP